MSAMKNYMMDIQEFCDGYSYGGKTLLNDFTIDEIVEDVHMYFKTSDAAKYARLYLTEQLGES